MKNTTPAPHETQPLLLTKRAAAKLLSICPRSLEIAVARKAIAVVRLGKRCVRFRPEDLAAYVACRRLRAIGE